MNNYAVNIKLEVTELFCISTEQTNFTTNIQFSAFIWSAKQHIKG